MLDDTTTPNSADDLPRPPSGRRSASRPAGPPRPVVADPVPGTPQEQLPALEADVPAVMKASAVPVAAETSTVPATDADPSAAIAGDSKPARKRAPRKTAAKKAAEAIEGGEPQPARKRAPRKSAKKAAAAPDPATVESDASPSTPSDGQTAVAALDIPSAADEPSSLVEAADPSGAVGENVVVATAEPDVIADRPISQDPGDALSQSAAPGADVDPDVVADATITVPEDGTPGVEGEDSEVTPAIGALASAHQDPDASDDDRSQAQARAAMPEPVATQGAGVAPDVSETGVAPDAPSGGDGEAAADDDDLASQDDDIATGDEPAGETDFHAEIARRLTPGLANPFAPPAVISPRETEEALASLATAIAGDTEDESPESSEDSDDDAAQERRPRRRRRGGRRRRRSGDRDVVDETTTDDEDIEGEASPEVPAAETAGDSDAEPGDEPADDADGSDESGDSTRRRRRRRRRRGESTDGDDDPSVEVVNRVRERRRGSASDEVTGIEGSTRMEAKRQRRREGRSAGRRRSPILSEAEFLSRREAVARTMVIRQKDEYTQIGVMEDNVLVEHYVDRKSSTGLIGNIYLGRVQNVLPSMEAAFIDIGRGRNAVLYAGEVDWDAYGSDGQSRKIESVFKSGQSVLVQVTKDPVGAKGARLTNHISLPGRYIVFSPGGELSGISRKLPDTERARLKSLLDNLIPQEASVIVRTAAEGVEEDDLVRDVNRLTAQWEAIDKKAKTGHAPQLLYAEPDATVRIVRDLFTEDFAELVVDGNGSAEDAYDMISAYVEHVAPHLMQRLRRWDRDEAGDLFAKYRIDEQIAKALERKVFLPSGGSLIIDRTEAMTVIDVNTGKFTGAGGNLEATVTSNNLEAAEEIVRQLRLRDIGGIIVIDFIDMVLPSNRDLLLRRLVECLGRDRTRHQVAEVTSLGLVQMTRKKIGTGLAEAFTEQCDECKGRGYVRHEDPVESQAPADGGERSANKGRPARNRGGRGTKNVAKKDKKTDKTSDVPTEGTDE